MEKFIDLIIKRRWLVATAFVLVCAFGVYAWGRLSLDAYPDIADTTVQVVTQVPGLAAPELNPLTSPTGEVYRYILKSDNHSLRELTDLNKWVVIPRLTQIPGVASVSNYGGITTQYQLEIDPDKLSEYGISLSEVEESINLNNSNAGGSTLVRGNQSYVVRAEGLITDLKDMENIVVKNINGTPVFLSDLGHLRYGNLERKGIMGYIDDDTDCRDGVEGIVLSLVAALAVMVGKDFLPTLDEGGIWIQVQTPPGISLDRSAEMADSLRDCLKQFPEVTCVMTQVGRDDEGTEAFSPSHIECSVGLKPYKEWKTGRDKAALIAAIEAEAACFVSKAQLDQTLGL